MSHYVYPCRYCPLYGGCEWYTRVSKYQTSWTMIGENIAMTYLSLANDPAAALVGTRKERL